MRIVLNSTQNSQQFPTVTIPPPIFPSLYSPRRSTYYSMSIQCAHSYPICMWVCKCVVSRDYKRFPNRNARWVYLLVYILVPEPNWENWSSVESESTSSHVSVNFLPAYDSRPVRLLLILRVELYISNVRYFILWSFLTVKWYTPCPVTIVQCIYSECLVTLWRTTMDVRSPLCHQLVYVVSEVWQSCWQLLYTLWCCNTHAVELLENSTGY